MIDLLKICMEIFESQNLFIMQNYECLNNNNNNNNNYNNKIIIIIISVVD